MNYHDTERMHSLLAEQGYEVAAEPENANLIIINSCSIRGKSEHKAMSGLGWLKSAKKKRPETIIGFAGCVAQQEKESLFQSAPHLDFVMGTDSIDQLPELIYRARNGEKKITLAEFDGALDYSIETKVLPGKASAYVNIMKGCDNFCTYCIVPFTRGREKSRKPEEVVEDIRKLLLQGVVDVMLLGQNVNSYGKSLGGRRNGFSFARLLMMIQKMADQLEQDGLTDITGMSDLPRGLVRLRYTTSHPKDFDEEMIDCHTHLSRLVPHLHLPVQSGSETVLRQMKRYVPIDLYISRLDKLRKMVPGIAISTDMIVGFPGEEAVDFEATLALMDRIRYDNIYAYAYSPRPGTAALAMGDPVPEIEKKRRLNLLMQKQNEIQAKINQKYQGKTLHVLVEGPSKSNFRMLTGRTPHNKILNFPKPNHIRSVYDLVGQFVPVKVTETSAFALKGEFSDC